MVRVTRPIFNFDALNHISETAKAKFVKFCTQIEYIKCQLTYTGGSQRWLITVTVEVVIRKSINDTHGIACSLCYSCA